MPRDATATRDEMIRAATRLFAERGIYGVTMRELNEASGQRNASALQYHFGSREGLLRAIIERYQQPIDEARAAWLERAGDLRGYVAGLVEPLARSLDTPEGRDYLQIIAAVVSDWGAGSDMLTDPPNARRTLERMAAELDDLPEPQRNLRVTNAVVLVTHALASRARVVRADRTVLPNEAFVAELITMVVGALEARSDHAASRV